MYIDKVDIYKFGRVYTKKKKLELEGHFSNNNLIDSKKFINLISDLQDAWDCSHLNLEVQVRFIPRGTEEYEK